MAGTTDKFLGKHGPMGGSCEAAWGAFCSSGKWRAGFAPTALLSSRQRLQHLRILAQASSHGQHIHTTPNHLEKSTGR